MMVRYRGRIASITREKRFIFIRPDGESRQIFCPRSELRVDDDEQVRRGLRVEFELAGEDEDQARDVRPLES